MARKETYKLNRRNFLIAAGAGTLAGCSGNQGQQTGTTQQTVASGGSTKTQRTTAAGQEQISIKMAVSVFPAAPASTRILVGREKGIFEEHGIDVEKVVSFGGGSQVTRGIVTGGLDVGLGGLAAVVQGFLGEAPIHIVGIGVGYSTIEFLSTDPKIQSIQDVKGKTIAVTGKGGSAEATAIQSIRNADKISMDDIEFRYAGGLGESITVAKEGGADVTWAVPPKSLSMISGDWHRVWRVADYAKYVPSQVFSMGSKLLDEQPERASRIMEAFIDAGNYVKNNKEESFKIWAEALEIPEKAALGTIDLINFEREFQVTPEKPYFTNTGKTMIQQGLIDEQPPWKKIIRQEPLPDDKQADWLK